MADFTKFAHVTWRICMYLPTLRYAKIFQIWIQCLCALDMDRIALKLCKGQWTKPKYFYITHFLRRTQLYSWYLRYFDYHGWVKSYKRIFLLNNSFKAKLDMAFIVSRILYVCFGQADNKAVSHAAVVQ